MKYGNNGSDNGLSPGQRQAIIWTNAGWLSIGTSGTNVSEFFIEIHSFSFNKMHLKMSSGKWKSSCPGLNVLIKQFDLIQKSSKIYIVCSLWQATQTEQKWNKRSANTDLRYDVAGQYTRTHASDISSIACMYCVHIIEIRISCTYSFEGVLLSNPKNSPEYFIQCKCKSPD